MGGIVIKSLGKPMFQQLVGALCLHKNLYGVSKMIDSCYRCSDDFFFLSIPFSLFPSVPVIAICERACEANRQACAVHDLEKVLQDLRAVQYRQSPGIPASPPTFINFISTGLSCRHHHQHKYSNYKFLGRMHNCTLSLFQRQVLLFLLLGAALRSSAHPFLIVE